VADRSGLPLSVSAGSAAPHESRLVEQTLEARFVKAKPERLIGDKAYDSDGLDEGLKAQGIEVIAPHRENRRGAPKQVECPSGDTGDAGRPRGCSRGWGIPGG